MKKIIYIIATAICLLSITSKINAQSESGININFGNITTASGSTGAILDNRNIYIPKETIQKMFFVTTGNDQVHKYMRRFVISKLIDNKFSSFASQPNF